MYRDEYTLAAPLHNTTASMAAARSYAAAALSSSSTSPASSRKPSFRIVLPPKVSLLGLALDGSIDHPLPSIIHPAATPPDGAFSPSCSLAHHNGLFPLTHTPPSDTYTDAADIALEPHSEAEGIAEDGMDLVEVTDNAITASVKLAVEKVVATSHQTRTIRAVHQLSPSPIVDDDEERPVSIVHSVLAELQSHEGQENWVSLVHAIPERYPLRNISPSPSTTPSKFANVSSDQDYFSLQRVVHSVVVIGENEMTSSHHSASPISPLLTSTPYSVEISLLQRIIPPSTPEEVRDFFDGEQQSLLASRLTELAPSGRLILVYPTHAGALTFQRDYLDRTLAPITRSVIFGKGLPSEACAAVANSGAADAVPAYEEMNTLLNDALNTVATRTDSRRAASWSILSSEKQLVSLPDKVWQPWWVLQEDGRVREVMDYYFRQLSRQSFYRDERFTANELARQITSDLTQRRNEEVERPQIEVGVFVIERNS